ncbi:hypothetical protein ABW19_dt0207410 [Dactylella cylindrospora]|nr:hypothetical protein ABW19_dt0207410 [Dactylella cylindrospora]
MHFSISLIATALVGATTVLAAPTSKYTKCDVSGVKLDSSWLVDSNNTANALTAPLGTEKLGKLVIGVGSQNYSCENGVPVANGAVAVLYDISCAASTDIDFANTLTRLAVHTPPDAQAQGLRVFQTMIGAQFTTGFHFFKGDFATPAFEFLDKTRFYGKVDGKVPALAGSDAGKKPDAYGAVPSLRLVSKPGMGSTYTSVYRLHTAGGIAPTKCDWTGQYQIPYAAQYWLYKQ